MGLVSLVLATYGRCDDVGRMLDSLVAQTDTAFEVLIVDQNPDDRLYEHVERGMAAGLTIRHLRLDQPSLSGARNFGIAQAKGQVIGFPDDDCWYEPATVARVRSAFAQKSTTDGVVGCWVELAASSGDVQAGSLSYAEWRRFQGKGASSITLFFRRHLFERLGGFDERFGVDKWYGAGEETDLILRVLASGARLDYCSPARVHHALSHSSGASLLSLCRTMRKRGRGVGGIYGKHEMSTWVILRGLAGLVLRPLRAGRLKATLVGLCASLGSLEGFLKWRLTEQKNSPVKQDSSLRS